MASNCTKVASYYSISENVYHVCKNCSRGYAIEPDKLKTGDPGKRTLCDNCQDIISSDRSMTDYSG
ncbi:MAG: hypothetical protein ACLP5H_26370 [Desulfomonilaceae bacterium]